MLVWTIGLDANAGGVAGPGCATACSYRTGGGRGSALAGGPRRSRFSDAISIAQMFVFFLLFLDDAPPNSARLSGKRSLLTPPHDEDGAGDRPRPTQYLHPAGFRNRFSRNATGPASTGDGSINQFGAVAHQCRFLERPVSGGEPHIAVAALFEPRSAVGSTRSLSSKSGGTLGLAAPIVEAQSISASGYRELARSQARRRRGSGKSGKPAAGVGETPWVSFFGTGCGPTR
ncbi:hypothetical protein BOSEA31B_12880 [Hyphomicrobiales bacterium]|nr:hypothetical protein BOSEA31B_12880 [Hyphomicrobiales bacterium]CAH1698654.1 hypothetical protein BOSEA1005_11707 [Hyphomicrobiales bacterium]CAI0342299.1 hypothetical protein BO1005MUT1_180078 [Hyphomicrobiales bacterium]